MTEPWYVKHLRFNPLRLLANHIFAQLTAIYIMLWGTEREKRELQLWLKEDL